MILGHCQTAAIALSRKDLNNGTRRQLFYVRLLLPPRFPLISTLWVSATYGIAKIVVAVAFFTERCSAI